ncbi:hypothetical protein N9I15_02530 [Flavobacteriaceae bacterium]|jgi:hypothetical protein|nr:hypothetical protein [Flavobacteriaceae bacterium]MDA8644324.1 hypothetical protein [Flavobacteriaceae bacterium]MDA8877505.1 hypothetical protein [Flavobacteriaceae bacterium]MDC0386214.1 hypothetical protein [Flavobacteriaceae bacterium]MDC0871792.1 hypothetical protein [Flavobacteriaceae bacterium]
MKTRPSLLFLILITVLISNTIWSQKEKSRFEELKAWKLSYIIENTTMNSKELEVYKCIFEDYENEYHEEIWTKVHQMRKTLRKSLDTINTKSAADYINEFDAFEIKGMEMKHQRNEKLLKKIRPKEVLNILYQEKRFDRELFNRIKKKRENEE